MHDKKIAVACLAAAVVGATAGHALMPRDLAAAQVRAPYCMYDHTITETQRSRWVGVTGPAGEMITINGHRKHRLVLIDEDVVDEVDLISGGDGTNADAPFTGLYYVEMKRKHRVGSITVRVNGHRCETT